MFFSLTFVVQDDCTTVVQTLIFNPNTSSVNIKVPIIDDSSCEGDEMFYAIITNPSDSRVILHPNQANVTIKDFGEGKCFVEIQFLLGQLVYH